MDKKRIDKQYVLDLIANKIPESKTIEYKSNISLADTKEKREFLKDFTALANTAGGILLFGISEEIDEAGKNTGIPKEVIGIDGNIDEIIRMMENILRDGIDPRIISYDIYPVTFDDDKKTIVCDIPKSWVSPHLITLNKQYNFYGRNSTGSYLLDVKEIRYAFAYSESLYERIRDFKINRINKIISNELPIKLIDGQKMILHVLPLQSFDHSNRIDYASQIKYDLNILRIKGDHLTDREILNLKAINYKSLYDGDNLHHYLSHNLDGFICGGPSFEKTFTYTQLFRNGCIEAVDAMISDKVKKNNLKDVFEIDMYEIQSELSFSLMHYLNTLQKLGIFTPILVFVTLMGFNGLQIDSKRSNAIINCTPSPFVESIIQVPEIVIESYDKISPIKSLQPIFDVIWQAGGLECCPDYDAVGEYKFKN